MATENNWEDVIRTNYTDLLEKIDADVGLHGELMKREIFTPIALRSFWEETDKTVRTDKMLRSLLRKDYNSFTQFCNALKGSGQKRVVENHLSRVKDVHKKQHFVTDSGAEGDSSHNRGISKEMKECLRQHHNDLILLIAFNEDLLGEIQEYKILTPIQLNRLRDKPKGMDRTEEMLAILEQGSEMQFERFCLALINCNQRHIVDKYLNPKTVQKQQATGENPTPSAPPQSSPIGRVAPFPLNVGHRSVNSEEHPEGITGQVRLQEAYSCHHDPRGRAVIISNEFFIENNLSQREGAQSDVRLLTELSKFLHLDPKVYQNKTDEEILNILRDESEDRGNSQCDMFVLFIMSHGIRGEIFGINGRPVKTKEIMELFDGKNCRSLCGKPKLIFIQACQGNLKTMGVTPDEGNMTVTDSVVDASFLEKMNSTEDFELSLPLEPLSDYQNDAEPPETVHEKADIALIYATVKGHVAWRHRVKGSLFVKYIDEVFRSKACKEDLISMITEVFDRLHSHKEDNHQYKQIGEKRDTLRRKVYMLP